MLATDLEAFVVPGVEITDALGLDLMAAGLRVASNPRHATLLVLVGEIPPGLARAAAVVYSQQPRPRAILSVGAQSPVPLPTADASVRGNQSALGEGVAELRRRIALGAWDPDPPAFVIEETHAQTAEMDHAQLGEMNHMHMPEMEHADMGGGGFMSMVMMTHDLPRSADGLPMEWIEVPFGPLFPGLPGGLGLVLTLDGDTVVRAEVRSGTVHRDLAATWPGPAETFADRLARLDPLASTAYRILACRALEQASGSEPDESEVRRRIAALERERAASHLTWLGRFGFLLGEAWLAHRASACARAIRTADDAQAFADVRDRIAAFLGWQRSAPLLRQRLHGVGGIEPEFAHDLRGPVARACGRAADTRHGDPAYRAVGFAPVIEEGADVYARLSVRLAEIEQSLELIRAVGIDRSPVTPKSVPDTATGRASVETPRGTASLVVTVAEGQVLDISLDVPSSANVHLVRGVAVGHELADGLLGIASLDLSPWELDK